jgi:hypothetical protein
MTVCTTSLLKLRLAVARFGEMDCAKWWNTKGMLSRLGESAVGRGLPKTHLFARARAVFAVAGQRCDEIFNPPDSYTLWRLPAETEDELEDTWARCLEQPTEWANFLEQLNNSSNADLLEMLSSLELISSQVAKQVNRLRRSDDARSVPLPPAKQVDDSLAALLAAGFSRGEIGKLAVPYVRMEGSAA